MRDEARALPGQGEARPERRVEPAVTIVVPTRNEAANVGPLVAELATALAGVRVELIFVDDSDDATPYEVARAAREVQALRIALIHRPPGLARRRPRRRRAGRHRGRAGALGLRDGRRPPAPGGDDPPTCSPTRRRTTLDLVLASRFADRTAAARAEPAAPLGLRASLIGASRILFPLRLRGVSDPLTGFFVVRREAVDLAALRPDGFKILLEILIRTPSLRVGEIGFEFGERHAGESKASPGEAWRYVRSLARLRLQTAPRRLARVRPRRPDGHRRQHGDAGRVQRRRPRHRAAQPPARDPGLLAVAVRADRPAGVRTEAAAAIDRVSGSSRSSR